MAANKEATESMALLAKLKSSLQKIYSSHHDMVYHYGTDICVTNDHGYVLFVVMITRSLVITNIGTVPTVWYFLFIKYSMPYIL